ncbi:unnamed protein product [Closterium sp. NIES-65]|nr:unnamed protein product [Closterium sp. NIES-65]
MDLHDEAPLLLLHGPTDSRFFSTVSRFPPCPHPPHQSTAPRLSPLHLISAPTSPLGTSGPQLCERLRCRERSRGGGEWGLLMGLAEAIEDVFGVEDGGAVVRWIYRQPHRSGGGGLKGGEGGVAAGAGGGHSYDAPVPPTPCVARGLLPLPSPTRCPFLSPSHLPHPSCRVPTSSAQYLLLAYRFLPTIPHLCNMGALFTGTRGFQCTPSRAPPHLPLTTLTLFSFLLHSSLHQLHTCLSYTHFWPTETTLLRPAPASPHAIFCPTDSPTIPQGTGALLTQEEVAAMAELHGSCRRSWVRPAAGFPVAVFEDGRAEGGGGASEVSEGWLAGLYDASVSLVDHG